ncbi:MAG: type II secretion system major pseudopilin GspG [Pseudomonadales bacterium]|jgi:general secretion pathway protein G|nr:type II secretion system major pseudopilin GspG [Pseudomonadales bacterium]
MPPGRSNARAQGFTLIEIMVVVVILGIMAALVVPNIAGRQEQAQRTAVESDLNALANALEFYRLDNFTYPSTEQGLRALVEKPSGYPEARRWKSGGYLRRLPDDPWGTSYQYLSTGERFELYSLGADGQEGGEGGAADIAFEGN